jgi:hypothetical protein
MSAPQPGGSGRVPTTMPCYFHQRLALLLIAAFVVVDAAYAAGLLK